MNSKALLELGRVSNKWLLNCVRYDKAKASPRTTLSHVRYFERTRKSVKSNDSPFSELSANAAPPRAAKLWKPFAFTILFSGASISGAAIWEYETFREKTHRLLSLRPTIVRRTGWRGVVQNTWNSLSEGQKLFAPICFANVLVFLAWRIPALQATMVRYFCSNPTASGPICWPMVLSTFSHYSFWHLAANMYVLHSFSGTAVGTLGREQFTALYLTSGVVSSFASQLYKTCFSLPGLSLGASGAIMGILGFTCMQYPDIRLGIIFLPMFTFTADTAIETIMMLDTLGCALKWRFFDHAAHLGGALTGIFWQKWGNAYIWQQREPLLTYWHKFRSSP